MLAQTAVIACLLEDDPSVTRFKLPACLEQTLETDFDSEDLTLDQRATKAAIAAETTINLGGYEPDATEVNTSIRNAVAAACVAATSKGYFSDDRKEVVLFAKQLTGQLIYNHDDESTVLALETLNCFKAYLIAYDDDTVSPRKSILRAVKEVQDGPLGDELSSSCDTIMFALDEFRHIKMVKHPRKELGAAMLDAMYVARGSNPPTRGTREKVYGSLRASERSVFSSILQSANF